MLVARTSTRGTLEIKAARQACSGNIRLFLRPRIWQTLDPVCAS